MSVPSATATGIGDFLRAYRGRIEPRDAGMPSFGRRRVQGLRREEVAALAGVSADYYTRLEQGRERHPSPQVLTAIGRALRLDDDARNHLYRIAGLGPDLGLVSTEDRVHPALLEFLDCFPTGAGYVLSPAFDVMEKNAVAAALLSPFDGMNNMVRVLLQHPDAPVVFAEWESVVQRCIHALRLNAGRFPNNPQIRSLVDDLSRVSPVFNSLWQDQIARALTRRRKTFIHPRVGRIELDYQSFDVPDAPGQLLLVGVAAKGSDSAERLARLVGALR